MNAHRVNWIGRDGVKGRWCHAPGCWTYAATVKAQQVHADVHEPGMTLPTDGLIDEEGEA